MSLRGPEGSLPKEKNKLDLPEVWQLHEEEDRAPKAEEPASMILKWPRKGAEAAEEEVLEELSWEMTGHKVAEVSGGTNGIAEEVVALSSTMLTRMKAKDQAAEDLRKEEEKEQLAVLQALTTVEVKDLRDQGQLLLAVVQEELVGEKDEIEEIGRMTIMMMRMIRSLVEREKEEESQRDNRKVQTKKAEVKKARKAKMTTRISLLAIRLAKTVRKETWKRRKKIP